MNDFILNGQAHGSVASILMNNGFDHRTLRPYIGEDGRHYITQNVNGKDTAVLCGNATATLRKDEWKTLDAAVIAAAKPRLKAVADLRSAGLTYNVPNAMGKTVLETETQSDINDADVSMDGLRQGANDRPLYELTSLPLPIVHKDFSFSARQIATSRNGGSPLDTTMAALAGRKVAETLERMLIGTYGTYAYGGGTIYGYTNYPNRLTKVITAPTDSSWTGDTLLTELLAMKQQLKNSLHYGPYKVYFGTGWDQYLGGDYKAATDKSLKTRLSEISDLTGFESLDYLEGTDYLYDIIMVQMTSDVVRTVLGMDITTMQWETQGGLMQNYKVMAIQVPQLRCDQYDNCGLLHAGPA
jgi:hypothetical protein